ncbi:bacteriocin formation protein [Bacillus paralicheniformis]|nr:bacteriocin formation protein [Bacillus paralicheniformis]
MDSMLKGTDSERLEQIKFWSRFFYNNEEYMKRSLNEISGINIDHILALKFGGKKSAVENVHPWFDDWDLILKGALDPLPARQTEQNKKFGTFIDHFLKLAFSKLKTLYIHNHSFDFSENELYSDLLEQMNDDIYSICHKTLVLELNVYREQGLLKGSTPEERYDYFEHEILTDKKFLSSFGSEYQSLISLLIHKVNSSVSFIRDIVEHLENDWPVLIKTFPKIGRLRKIHLGKGDTHDNGKSVSILEFEGGQSLVYKPRPLDADQQYQKLLSWLNAQENNIPNFYKMKVVNADDHGWTEFIQYKACQSAEEVKDFYKRMGAQLAVLYVLNATDFHYGNIIAMGGHPVFVDMESLFHQNIYDDSYSKEALGQADKMLSKSIMASGMLPNLLYQRKDRNKSGVDLSGLGGKGNQRLPFEVAQIVDKGTDQAYLKKGIAFLEAGLNLPSYNGKFVNLHDYLSEIVEGFTAVYRFMAANKVELTSQLQGFKQVRVRAILRPTAVYGEFLRSLVHPDLLRDPVDQEVFLHRLWLKCLQVPKMESIIIDEMEDLRRHDVPLFTTRPGERHLWSSNGRVIRDFFLSPAFDLVLEKIRSLDEKDLYGQLQVLHMVMLASSADHYADVEKIDPFWNKTAPAKEDFLEQAVDIGNYLLKTKIQGVNRNKKDLTWISTVLEGNNEVIWKISPVGLDLYNGNSGIALFLAYLSYFTGEQRFKEAAEQAIVPILNDMKKFSENPTWSLGAYSGVGGNLFTTILLAELWNDSSLHQQVEKALPGYIAMINEDTIFDYIGGATGALDILLCIFHRTGSIQAVKGAISCGKHLMKHGRVMKSGGMGWPSVLDGSVLTGYSHGTGGTAAALSSLNYWTENKAILPYISKALEYERTFYDEKEKNWRTPGRDTSSYAWCHGAPGILLSRLRLKENGWTDPLLDREIEVALETTLHKGFGNNRSYCHGDFGQLEILLYAKQVLQDRELDVYIESVRSQLLEIVKQKMWNYGISRGTEAKGLMTGLAGIGMGLLKQYDSEAVPNILNLENKLLERR